MSIAGGLSSAFSGLSAAAKSAEIVSSNIANAQTEGYARRELQLSARITGSSGSGVQIGAVLRISDSVLVGDRRIAEAGAGNREAQADFLARLEGMLGSADSANSLGARINAFDAALIEAAGRPESEARLSQVSEAARSLVSHIGTAANDIQTARTTADKRIALEVEQMNTALGRVADINRQIQSKAGSGRDLSALIDQRQLVIDKVAAIVPLREVPQRDGQVALYSTGGAVLLDGRPARLGFVATGGVEAGMTRANGALSGITLNGRAISISGENSQIGGGTLGAQFAIRDEIAPEAQARLDAVSRDLVERFSASSLDSTRAPGDPGLFTDEGAAFLPANETGLAQRIRLNAAVDPEKGGALWRLRDGLGATTPGNAGDSRLLKGLQAALVAQRAPVSGGFMAGSRSFSALSADMLSSIATDRLAAEGEASFTAARVDTLRTVELEGGVDTDKELQSLLLIEQSYSANARVIQTIDDMIQTILAL